MVRFKLWRNLSVLIRQKNKESREFRDDVAAIIKDYLPGEWQNVASNELIIRDISSGTSNQLFQISLPQIYQKKSSNEPNTVILRVKELLSPDSVFEILSQSLAFSYVSQKGLGPKAYAIFPGGQIEEYIEGRSLMSHELRKETFSMVIAEKIAHLHSLVVPLPKKKGFLFDLMEKWLDETSNCDSSKINNVDVKKCVEYFKSQNLVSEICWLRNFFGRSNSPILFCHNDLQEGNILVTHDSVDSEIPNITLIDYEYCFYNYRGFEFANHFIEYTMSYNLKDYPHFVVNETNYPSVDHQSKFIRQYLTVSKKLQKQSQENGSFGLSVPHSSQGICTNDDNVCSADIEQEVDQLLKETSEFRLASHLLWGIWAASRSNSNIKFGYWDYSRSRLEAYFKVKEEIQNRNTK